MKYHKAALPIALAAALTLFAACGPKNNSTPEDPCESVTCSGHGQCAVQQDQAICLCDDGYIAQGLSCLKDPCEPNPCNEPPKPTCEDTQHVRQWPSEGTCEARSGGAVCDYGDGTLIDCFAESKQCVAGQCVAENTAPPEPGDLVMTELLYDPEAVDDQVGEFIEIFNLSTKTIDLNGLVITNQAAATVGLSAEQPMELESGSYFLIGASEDIGTGGSVLADFVAAEFSMSNSGDHISLTYNGEIIDEVTYDNGGGFPAAQGAAISLDPSHLNAADNDQGTSWCLAVASFGTGDLGTPKASNPPCANPCNPNPCTSPPDATCNGDTLVQPERQVGLCTVVSGSAECDYGEITTDCSLTGQVCDPSSGSCTGGASAPDVGDLVVTEIMKDPYIIDDFDGEWFEILNTSAEELDLNGLEVTDDQANVFVVSAATPLIVPSGGYFVFGVNADLATNGGVVVDYEYTALILDNAEDGLTLSYGGNVIDEVHYDDGAFFPDPNGASLTLDPNHLTAADNDDGSFWCVGETLYHPNNAGTPGGPNDICPVSDPCDPNPCTNPPDAWCDGTIRNYPTLSPGTCTNNGGVAECNYAVQTEDCASSGMDCENGQCVSPNPPPSAGDLVITEIMANPASPIYDDDGEWFEILNVSGQDLDIQGLTARDQGTNSFTLPTGAPIILAAGDYFVMGRNGDPALNGGVTLDYQYSSQMQLANSDDEIILEVGGVLIDEVAYDDLTFPLASGASMSLDPGLLTATDNDLAASWCEATTQYATDNLGTPGAANDACP